MKIVLDPGHGGPDPGAVGPTGLTEAEVVLDVAHHALDMLQVDGHDVRLTREADTYVSLGARSDFANKWGAGLFISIHCNAFTDPGANGTEVWYYEGSTAGQSLATAVQRELVNRLRRRDRGIKPTKSLSVLRRTSMPAVLLELAFISNPAEEQLMRSDGIRTLVAVAIYDAVREWAETNK